MKLYKHQQNIVDKNPDCILLAWSCGTGKSLASISLANKKPEKEVLVICPKSLKPKWIRDCELHIDKSKTFLVLTKEEFKRQYQKIGRFGIVIIDEFHYFSSPTSQLSKTLYGYLKAYKVIYRIGASATPYLSSPWNIYTLAKHLGHEWGYISFRMKFFYTVNMGGRQIPMIRKGIEEDIAKLVAKIGDIVKMEDAIDVPPQVFKEEYFELTGQQKVEINKMNREEFNSVVRYTKIHQIINGSLKGDGYVPDRMFVYEKVDRIDEYCRMNDKVAIICRYNLQIKWLESYLKDQMPHQVFVINGEVKNRDEVVQKVEASEKCIVLINASCSEGFELPSVNLILFTSLDFSYKNYSQLCGRFLRINNPTKNVYIHMIVKDTIDEAVYKSMLAKKDFDIAIYSQEKWYNIAHDL